MITVLIIMDVLLLFISTNTLRQLHVKKRQVKKKKKKCYKMCNIRWNLSKWSNVLNVHISN
jgi:hypothetical protein